MIEATSSVSGSVPSQPREVKGPIDRPVIRDDEPVGIIAKENRKIVTFPLTDEDWLWGKLIEGESFHVANNIGGGAELSCL